MLRSFCFAALTLLMCSACSSIGFPGVYKLNIPQGNIVKQDMLDELGLGMTKRQVRYVMGTPMIKDTFNQDRWDYVFTHQRGDRVFYREHIFLLFENDRLVEINGELRNRPNAVQEASDNNNA